MNENEIIERLAKQVNKPMGMMEFGLFVSKRLTDEEYEFLCKREKEGVNVNHLFAEALNNTPYYYCEDGDYITPRF